MRPESMAVQFNLENMVAAVRTLPKAEILSFLESEWEKYNPLERYQLFVFAVLDLASGVTEDLDDSV